MAVDRLQQFKDESDILATKLDKDFQGKLSDMVADMRNPETNEYILKIIGSYVYNHLAGLQIPIHLDELSVWESIHTHLWQEYRVRAEAEIIDNYLLIYIDNCVKDVMRDITKYNNNKQVATDVVWNRLGRLVRGRLS